MTKAEIIAALVAAGIEHDPTATNAVLSALLPKEETATKKPKTVKVTALRSLAEPSGVYAAGDTFETTPERAKALGKLVKPASD